MIIRVFKYISDWLEAILRAASSQKPALQGKVLINVFGHAKSAEIMLLIQPILTWSLPQNQIHDVKDAECQTKDEFFFLSDILMSN